MAQQLLSPICNRNNRSLLILVHGRMMVMLLLLVFWSLRTLFDKFVPRILLCTLVAKDSFDGLSHLFPRKSLTLWAWNSRLGHEHPLLSELVFSLLRNTNCMLLCKLRKFLRCILVTRPSVRFTILLAYIGWSQYLRCPWCCLITWGVVARALGVQCILPLIDLVLQFWSHLFVYFWCCDLLRRRLRGKDRRRFIFRD